MNSRVAAALQERGLGRGARVVIMMRNRPEFLEVQGGTWRAGSAGVNASWRSTAPELGLVLKNCLALAIVFEADLWPVVEEARGAAGSILPRNCIAVGGAVAGCERYEEDFLAPAGAKPYRERGGGRNSAVVIYTSGTTGAPKGAVRRFRSDSIFPFMHFSAEDEHAHRRRAPRTARSTTPRRSASCR